VLLKCDSVYNQFHKNSVNQLENISLYICYRVLIHKRLSFSSSAFVLSLCFNINVFAEEVTLHPIDASGSNTHCCVFLKRQSASNLEIHLQAMEWLLLLDNTQNYCCSEFVRRRVSCFAIFCWLPNPV